MLRVSRGVIFTGDERKPFASVAQRQSSGFVNRRLWVQIPPLAPARSTAGRWPSGQWHQTVNLTYFVLRGFESLPAHYSKG
jgi:hypothetical protein